LTEALRPRPEPVPSSAGPPQTQRSVIRIGILLGYAKGLNKSALRYLLVHLNSLQTSFEYEFLPTDFGDDRLRGDPFLGLAAAQLVDREEMRSLIPAFLDRYRAALEQENENYKLKEPPPERFVLITLARFSDDWISMRRGNMHVVALGNWKRVLAPPSILEFILTLTMRESLAFASRSLSGSFHLGTKGCLCDFTSDLEETRLKTLTAFICRSCREALASDGLSHLADEVLSVLRKDWLGKSSEPNTPAGIISSLGYDLFLTKGLQPSWWQTIKTKMQDDGIKELIKLLYALAFAFLVFWWGWQKK